MWRIHRKFSNKSIGERILKIGPGSTFAKVIIKYQVGYFFELRQSVQGAAKTIMLSFHDYEKFIHQVERQIIHDCYIHIKTQVPSEMLQFLSYWVFFLPTHCTTYSYL